MVDPDALYIDEETAASPWGDPWGTPETTTATKLNLPLIQALITGPSDSLNDVSAALALTELAYDELHAYGTGGGNKLDDSEIRVVLRSLRATSSRVGVTVEFPFKDFSGFRSYWLRNDGHGSWQARRDMVDGFLNEARETLENLEVRPRGPGLPPTSLAGLRDPAAILDNLDRIQRAIPTDPAQAVGSAKELIESTAKTVLIERDRTFDERKDDLQALVREAQQALMLHPSQATPGPDGTDAVKKILGGITSVAIGVAELRNRGYGTGHGAAGKRIGLNDRHAHLAVNAAMTWCQLMLATLADAQAPWRAAAEEAAS